ncbi:MAG: hypothetical protein GPOALKHO_001585 [Sodalis sp.]|nr:MAG: hypothetical protein GPOALKHO_001585 [Sodalis sp.]
MQPTLCSRQYHRKFFPPPHEEQALQRRLENYFNRFTQPTKRTSLHNCWPRHLNPAERSNLAFPGETPGLSLALYDRMV